MPNAHADPEKNIKSAVAENEFSPTRSRNPLKRLNTCDDDHGSEIADSYVRAGLAEV